MAATASAQSGRVFVFEGAGWGHRVGMSQWGAYGQALEDPDKPGEEIAAYYYPGSEPGSLSDLSLRNDLLTTLDHPLWVNLGSQITLLEFTALGGPLELCLADDGEGPCPKPEQPQKGEKWEFRRIARNECGFFLGGELQGTAGSCRASISWPDATGVRLRYGKERSKLCASRRGRGVRVPARGTEDTGRSQGDRVPRGVGGGPRGLPEGHCRDSGPLGGAGGQRSPGGRGPLVCRLQVLPVGDRAATRRSRHGPGYRRRAEGPLLVPSVRQHPRHELHRLGQGVAV